MNRVIRVAYLYLVFLILFSLNPGLGFGQDTTSDTNQIYDQLVLISERIDTIREELNKLGKKNQTNEVVKQSKELDLELNVLKKNFEARATQIAPKDLLANDSGKINWTSELQEIAKPLLQSIHELSKKPRKIGELENKIGELETQIEQYQVAEKNLNLILQQREKESVKNPQKHQNLLDKIEQLKTRYNSKLLELELEETQKNLGVIKQDKQTFWELFSDSAGEFFRVRGLNITIALAAFIVSFILLNTLSKTIRRKGGLPSKLDPKLRKVLKTTFSVVAITVSLGAGLFALYLRNDWLLFSIAILILFAIIWTSRQLIPQVIQELKIIMNLGSIREGERVIWGGVPWLIEEIGFFVTLSNPKLESGLLQIPVGKFMDLDSRPIIENEEWFPTDKNDYVMLEDGAYGLVESQTMERVILQRLGSPKYYPTADFLQLKPLNLSKGFLLILEFGLDYGIQDKICETIPELFENELKKSLQTYFLEEPPGISSLSVYFNEAAASSLNLIVLAKVDGKHANSYYSLKREINKIMVRICNENNLSIPFNQLTVHTSGENDTN